MSRGTVYRPELTAEQLEFFEDTGNADREHTSRLAHEVRCARLRIDEQRALIAKMDADFAAARHGLLDRMAALHDHLAVAVRDVQDDLSRTLPSDEWLVGARSALVRANNADGGAWENARAETADLLRRASELPGLTAELAELQHQRVDLAVQLRAMVANWDDVARWDEPGDELDFCRSDVLKLAAEFDRRDTASMYAIERAGYVRGREDGRREQPGRVMAALELMVREWRRTLNTTPMGIGMRAGRSYCLAALRALIADYGGDEKAGGPLDG